MIYPLEKRRGQGGEEDQITLLGTPAGRGVIPGPGSSSGPGQPAADTPGLGIPSLEKHQVSKTNSPSKWWPDTISSCTGKHSWCNLRMDTYRWKQRKPFFWWSPWDHIQGLGEEGQRVPLLSKKCISSESSFSLKKQKIGSWEQGKEERASFQTVVHLKTQAWSLHSYHPAGLLWWGSRELLNPF